MPSSQEPSDPRAAAAVRYLQRCYRTDIRASGHGHLLAQGVRCLHLFPREVVLCDVSDRVPLPDEDGETLLAEQALYRRERELVYFVGAVVGLLEVAGRRHRQCAPLLLAPATATRTLGEVQVQVASEDFTVNERALRPLVAGDGASEDVAGALQEALPPPPWSDGSLFEWAAAWTRHCPGVDPGPLRDLAGSLVGVAELRRLSARRFGGDQVGRVLPICGVALFPRPRASRGVLHELDLLARRPLVGPLRSLLLQEELGRDSVAPGPSQAPAILSKAQEGARRSAASEPLTVLVGPPGTGKSFTIAALALDRAARGQSVLIASGREAAIRVVEEKIAQLVGIDDLVMPTGSKDRLDRMSRRLEAILQGNLGHLRAGDDDPGVLERELRDSKRELEQLEETLTARVRWEDEARAGASTGWADPFAHLTGALRRWQLGRLPRHWEQLEHYEALLTARNELLIRRLRAGLRAELEKALVTVRGQIISLSKALRARQSARQADYFSKVDSGVLFTLFPIWTASFRDVHRALPFRDGHFDLVIVDEATQCDLATALPTLQRGRRALIAGDPQQLRHLSFLARSQMREIALAEGLAPELREHLDYRDRSLVDVALETAGGDAVHFLDEHFRSHPSLIAFSNEEIYEGSLRVMTARPGPRESRLEIREVNGHRGEDGVNRAEIAATVAVVERVLDRAKVSVGVLSVFREQAEAIREALFLQLGVARIEASDLLVGTPYAFQGEERDVMILSLALDESAPAAAWRHLMRRDVFNVSVTRARHRQIVLVSFPPRTAPGLVGRYLASASEPTREIVGAATAAVRDIEEALRGRGLEASSGAQVAGTTLDLVVEERCRESGGRRVLAVDLIGGDDPSGVAVDLARTRVLLRAGLSLFPLPLSAWEEDPDVCVEAIRAWLRKQPIV